eukprot:GFKZ01002551.1.p1 GENE.GFKZ01002551.1~~GFKZ01002551.1.p1  ORF type:complete len:455 (-),score=41.59 GFKZ01002551.1:393-1757(-)
MPHSAITLHPRPTPRTLAVSSQASARTATFDPLRSQIDEFFTEHKELHKSWLASLHSLAELAFQEHKTAEYVQSILSTYAPSLQVTIGLPCLPTSIVAVQEGNDSAEGEKVPAVLLRADMDGLPLKGKESNVKRLHEDVHHGCGHDGHTACLLACGHYLQHHPSGRKVVLFFQPAEERGGEHGSGAKVAIERGGLLRKLHSDVTEVFALHAWPQLHLGEMGIGKGVMMGESGRFWVWFEGKGGHAAEASAEGGDALLAGCGFVTTAQTVVARGLAGFEAAMVGFTRIEVVGSEGMGVVAGRVRVGGTVRGGSEGVIERVMAQVRRFAEGAGMMYGCEVRVEFWEGYGVTRNSVGGGEKGMKVAKRVGVDVKEVRADGELKPSLCAEDFSALLRERGGGYFWLGVGDGRGGLHEAGFRFPAEAVWWGARFWAMLAAGGGGDGEEDIVVSQTEQRG